MEKTHTLRGLATLNFSLPIGNVLCIMSNRHYLEVYNRVAEKLDS
jgi:hypothetical protein